MCSLAGLKKFILRFSLSDCKEYDIVKAAVLKAYELVPEAYRQKFRTLSRGVNEAHVEFARELTTAFNRWCMASEVTTFEELSNLIVLEQFKNSVPARIATYINEQKADTAAKAAELADDYVLTHKSSFEFRKSDELFEDKIDRTPRNSSLICNYCRGKGHWKNECPVLKSKSRGGKAPRVKPAVLVAPVLDPINLSEEGFPTAVNSIKDGDYAPFISYGHVSFVGKETKVPVTILRDTGASESFILQDVLPFSFLSDTGTSVLIKGIGLNVLSVPLHKIILSSQLVSGEVVVGVRPSLPVEGVDIIMGNNLAGGRVWPDIFSPPVVSSFPLPGPDESNKNFPEVFTACAVTRSMISAQPKLSSDPGVVRPTFSLPDDFSVHLTTEMEGDWEEGLPWLTLSAREVCQESTGFSPNDLVFGHTVRGPLAVLRDNWTESTPPKNLISYVNDFKRGLYEAGKMAKEQLCFSQRHMKSLYDRRTEKRQLMPGDQVLALLPVEGSPFQAQYTGPFVVVKQITELNYLIATPDRRKSTQLCHINLLKPYYCRSHKPLDAKAEVQLVLVVESTSPVPLEEEIDGVSFPEDTVLLGRLKNSETFKNLHKMFAHLPESKCADLIALINNYVSLFGDVPSRTHWLEHDIDVGDAEPIRQHFYRVSPNKFLHLKAEVQYMLDNDIARPSFSSWASPCLLVNKSDGTYRFCTDYRKINKVTKPDSFPLPRIEDCVDRVGSAKFVSKFDLLKGYWQVPLTQRAQEISAFITSEGLFSYNVMSFGLRNAPATFQRLMNRVVFGLEGVAVYLDDVVVFSDSWDQHLSRIADLFFSFWRGWSDGKFS